MGTRGEAVSMNGGNALRRQEGGAHFGIRSDWKDGEERYTMILMILMILPDIEWYCLTLNDLQWFVAAQDWIGRKMGWDLGKPVPSCAVKM